MRKYKLALSLAVICFFLLLFFGFLLFLQKSQPDADNSRLMTATLLKVGKADAIIIQSGENVIVIDAGEEEDGAEVQAFLAAQNISHIDTLIITHFDQDHVGGADTLVEQMDIGTVLLPAYHGTNTEYADFIQAMNRKSLTPQLLTEPFHFTLGKLDVLVEPPVSYEIPEGYLEYDNNFSLFVTVTYDENVLLFTGDAEKQRIREWLENGTVSKCDFLKVPHHGIYTTALQDLINATDPAYAGICTSKKHPADSLTLELLKSSGVRTFQTKDGNIIVTSDGKRLDVWQT